MKHIFGNLKKYWISVLIIGVLLIVQAFCDFSLPNLTSKLIDTGITNQGIEYATPDLISKETYMGIGLLMNEEEKELWNDSYSLEDDGIHYLNDGLDKAELDETFTYPMAAYVLISQAAGQSEQDMAVPPNEAVDFASIRSSIDSKLDSMGDSIVKGYAITLTKSEYENLDVDLNHIRNTYLWRKGGLMMLFALAMGLISIAIGFIASRVGAGVGRDLRQKIFAKVVSFSDSEINKFSTASLITRTTNDVQQVQQVTVTLLRMVLYAPVMAIGGIIMVSRTGAGMGYVIVIAVAAISVLVIALMIIAMPKFKIMQKLVDKVNLVSREMLTGISVIRAFGREKHEEKRFDKANWDLTGVMIFTNRVMSFMMPALMLIMNGISVLIVWVASHRIDAGTMEIGTMTAFITYTMMIVMSFLMLTMISIMLPRAGVAADRIHEVLTTESSIEDGKLTDSLKNAKGVVKFSHVDFAYPTAEGKVLEDIDFVAEPGTTTAIIGSTGCGKSTLVNLIPRFFDVTGGVITIDGTDIRDMSVSELRANIGYVPQKGILFSGTIADNIKFGQANDSDKDMVEAAVIAQAEEFINEKAKGYDSEISQGGTNVSGGQKQRLAIARAIARNPLIYIFDDSFSALDFKTDLALRKALGPKIKDKTVFIVAQRISTILHADNIIVLDEGRIAGMGSHNELMENCEVYRQIAISQLSEKELNTGAKEEA